MPADQSKARTARALTALAVTVAVAIKVVGVLLIAAMLIIPARRRTPAIAYTGRHGRDGGPDWDAIGGRWSAAAYIFDTPAGPSIVCVAAPPSSFESVLKASNQLGKLMSPNGLRVKCIAFIS
jgi:zinc transport system permease protein